MEILCSVDGESLSRFIDGELPPSAQFEIERHVSACAECELRLAQFRLADGLLSRVRAARPNAGRIVASLSVAAALVASLATNALLNPAGRAAPQPLSLELQAAPSETLTSFYAKVAPAPSPAPLTLVNP